MFHITRIFSLRRLNNNLVQALYRGFRAAFLLRTVSVALTFLLQIFLARLLGADAFGSYVFVLAWIGFLVLFGKFGLDTASLRYLPAYLVNVDSGLATGFIHFSMKVVILFSTIISLVSSLVIWILPHKLGEEVTELFYIGFLILPAMALLQLYSARIQAMKHVGLAQVPQGIIKPLVLGALVIVFVFIGIELDAYGILWLEFITLMICLFIAWQLFRKRYRAVSQVVAPALKNSEWLSTAYSLFFISVAQLGLAKADVLMIGSLDGTKNAGLYAVASLIASLVTFFIGSANHFIAPTVSELYAKSKQTELQHLITVSTVSIALITIPVLVGLILGGEELLGLFGEEFRSQYPALMILLAGQFVIVLWGSVGFLLTMSEFQKEASRIIWMATVINIILNALFIPAFGTVGAAAATSISVALRSIILGIYVWKLLRIMPPIFGPLLRLFP